MSENIEGFEMAYTMLPIEEIDMRLTLRDIRARRFTLLPIPSEELERLIDLGLVEIQDDIPHLTEAGNAKIEW